MYQIHNQSTDYRYNKHPENNRKIHSFTFKILNNGNCEIVIPVIIIDSGVFMPPTTLNVSFKTSATGILARNMTRPTATDIIGGHVTIFFKSSLKLILSETYTIPTVHKRILNTVTYTLAYSTPSEPYMPE